MASFKNRSKDDIPSATLITELIPLHISKKHHCLGLESWSCAFAPDESYFAWSSGNCVVTLIPWSFCKSTLFKSKEITVPFTLGNGKHEMEDCFGCNTISVNTGQTIRSVAFGISAKSYISGCAPFWARLSSSKDLVLATGHVNGRIRVWDVLTGKLILQLMDHHDTVSHLAFSPIGDLVLASSSYDGTLKVWNFQEDGNMFKTLKMNNKPIYSCCWSPDAKSLASVGMCKMVHVWDTITMTLRLKLQGHHHDIVACSFSPDGCLIASASWDTTVILWNACTGHIIKCFGHLHPSPRLIFACGYNSTWIRDVSFSSDGAHIATVADDGYLRFWDITSEENPEAIATVENSLSCTFSPSGHIVAVGSKNGPVTFWSAPLCIKPLLYLTRIAIRKIVSAENVEKLSIPFRLKKYLSYSDLE